MDNKELIVVTICHEVFLSSQFNSKAHSYTSESVIVRFNFLARERSAHLASLDNNSGLVNFNQTNKNKTDQMN